MMKPIINYAIDLILPWKTCMSITSFTHVSMESMKIFYCFGNKMGTWQFYIHIHTKFVYIYIDNVTQCIFCKFTLMLWGEEGGILKIDFA